MGSKSNARADRRAARQLTAQELRERATHQQDRIVRGLLAKADSLRVSISNTRHLPLPAILMEPRTVSYPIGGRHIAADRDLRCDQATMTEVVTPWAPAPGDATLEGPWGGAGGWTADLVREWLAEAMTTLRACPTDHPGGGRSSMPDVVQDAVLAYGWSDVRIRVLPSPAALGRLDVVLQWLYLIEDVDQRKAVVGVAMGMPLRRIARTIRRSHTHVATLERKAVEQLVGTLNDERVADPSLL